MAFHSYYRGTANNSTHRPQAPDAHVHSQIWKIRWQVSAPHFFSFLIHPLSRVRPRFIQRGNRRIVALSGVSTTWRITRFEAVVNRPRKLREIKKYFVRLRQVFPSHPTTRHPWRSDFFRFFNWTRPHVNANATSSNRFWHTSRTGSRRTQSHTTTHKDTILLAEYEPGCHHMNQTLFAVPTYKSRSTYSVTCYTFRTTGETF